MQYNRLHNASGSVLTSYLMLDITGLTMQDVTDLMQTPEIQAALVIIGKFCLALFSAYIGRKLDRYLKEKEAAEK